MNEFAELKRLAEAVRDNDIDWEPNQKTYDYFQALRDPYVVLAMIAENEALREEVVTDDKIIAERDRLLNMFECPAHGQCVTYAMEQVEALRKNADRYQWLMSSAVMNGTLGIQDGWIDFEFKDEAQEQIDAAMGAGDQP